MTKKPPHKITAEEEIALKKQFCHPCSNCTHPTIKVTQGTMHFSIIDNQSSMTTPCPYPDCKCKNPKQ